MTPHRFGVGVGFLFGLWIALVLGDVLSLAFYLPYAIAGAWLAVRRPVNPIGWCLIAIGWSVAIATVRVTSDPGSLATGAAPMTERVIAWGAGWSWTAAQVLILILTLIFPSGDLPRPHRTAARALIAIGIACVFLSMIQPTLAVGTSTGGDIAMLNPFAVVPDAWLWTVLPSDQGLFLVAVLLLLVGVGSLFSRARRASGLERVQYRWLVATLILGATGTAAGLVISSSMGMAAGDPRAADVTLLLAWLPAMIGIALVPVSIGIAVLRYRLYEIDRIISRTIGWAIVTGVLVGAFVLLVLGLTNMLQSLTGGNTVAVAGSTLAVAALFAPVRSRVQRLVDRRFDRSRYDVERLLADFGERLRDEVDLSTISRDARATVDAAVRPTSVGLWLRGGAPDPTDRPANVRTP